MSRSLSAKFVLMVFLCSVVVFSTSIALEIYTGYMARQEKVDEYMEFVRDSYLPPIRESLYKLDKQQTTFLLEAVIKLEGISQCKIISDGEVYLNVKEDDYVEDTGEQKSYSLFYKHESGREYDLGELIVGVDRAELRADFYQLLLTRVLLLFFGLCVQAVLVSLFFYNHIGSNLKKLAHFVGGVHLENLSERFQLDREPAKDDEIDRMVTSFNTLLSRLENEVKEKEQAEDKLRKSDEAYNVLLDGTNDAVCIVQDGMMVFCNQPVMDLTGYTYEELRQTPFLDMVHEEDRDRVYKRYLEGLEGKLPSGQNYNFRGHRKDGSVRLIEINLVLIEWEGRPATLNFLRDLTEQRNLEEQLAQSQKMDSIGRLAGGVAHDLNNLLSPIIGYSELLKLGVSDPKKMEEGLEQITSAGNKARDLIRQLLTFSRKQKLKYQLVDLTEVVEELQKLLERTIREDVTIQMQSAKDLPLIHADIGQIEQIIVNLVVNASDAMPNGGKIIIETSHVILDDHYTNLHLGVEPGPYALLIVTDTGVGMPSDVKDKIFEPFYTTKGEHGTGLGLATVYGIIKQHKGNVSVYSEAGKGTTFKVFLPISEEQQAQVEHVAKVSLADLQGDETILLVEDNYQVRDLAREMLEMNNYKVLLAESGSEAIEIYKNFDGEIDILLTDVIMPSMNGKELHEELVKLQPNLKTIYMSGYTSDVIDHHGVFEEDVVLVQKPFSSVELISAIRKKIDQ